MTTATLNGDGCTVCANDIGYACTRAPSVCSLSLGGETCVRPVVVSSSGQFTGDFSTFVNDYDPVAGGCTGWAASGPDVAYEITLAAGQTLDASVDSVTGTDLSLYLVTDCADVVNSCLVGDDSGNPEVVSYTAVVPETLYLIVDRYGSAASGLFTLDITITP